MKEYRKVVFKTSQSLLDLILYALNNECQVLCILLIHSTIYIYGRISVYIIDN